MKLFANITLASLAKLVTFDFLAGFIAAVFVAGMLWSNISESLAQAMETGDKNEAALAVMTKEVTKISTDVELMKQRQSDYQESQAHLQAIQANELRDIKRMLMRISQEEDE